MPDDNPDIIPEAQDTDPTAPDNSDPANPLHVLEYQVYLIDKGFDWLKEGDQNRLIDNGKSVQKMLTTCFANIEAIQKILLANINSQPPQLVNP